MRRSVLALLGLATACGDTGAVDLPPGAPPPGPPLRVVAAPPQGGIVGTPFTFALDATGGSGPLTWSLDGAVPGLRLSPEAGRRVRLEGTPTLAGRYPIDVRVEDDADAATFSADLRVVDRLLLTAGPLPDAVLSEPYRATLEATEGAGDHRWSLAQGSLPPGLALEPTGARAQLFGRPGAVGDFPVVVQVEDAFAQTATRAVTVRVALPSAPLAMSAISLPALAPCEGFALTVTATGGHGAGYRWRLVGDVPEGVSVEPAEGPTTTLGGLFPGGRFAARLELEDGDGAVVVQDILLEAPAPTRPPGFAVVQTGFPSRTRNHLVDLCRRVPAVTDSLPGVDHIANTHFALAANDRHRYVAWAHGPLQVTTGDRSRLDIRTLPDTVDLLMAISDIAPDGRATLYYSTATRAGLGHRFATLTSTSVSAPFTIGPSDPGLDVLALHPLGVVLRAGNEVTAHRIDEPGSPGIVLASRRGTVFSRTAGEYTYGRFANELRRVSFVTGAIDAWPAVNAGLGPRGRRVLAREAAAGPWAVADAPAPQLVWQTLPGSEACGGAWAWSADGETAACIAQATPSVVHVWDLTRLGPMRTLRTPTPIARLWLDPSGSHVVFNASRPGETAQQLFAQATRPGAPIRALTDATGLESPLAEYEVRFAQNRIAIEYSRNVWIWDLARQTRLFESRGGPVVGIGPWRADGTGLFVRTDGPAHGIEWLDLLPPTRPRVRALGAPDTVDSMAGAAP